MWPPFSNEKHISFSPLTHRKTLNNTTTKMNHESGLSRVGTKEIVACVVAITQAHFAVVLQLYPFIYYMNLFDSRGNGAKRDWAVLFNGLHQVTVCRHNVCF